MSHFPDIIANIPGIYGRTNPNCAQLETLKKLGEYSKLFSNTEHPVLFLNVNVLQITSVGDIRYAQITDNDIEYELVSIEEAIKLIDKYDRLKNFQ